MFEMATGKPPFATTSLKNLIQMILETDTPSVPGFSAEFNDLVSKLLEKDPIKRITWPELRRHPFWSANAPVITFKKGIVYPEQPQFDTYLISRGIVPQHFYDQRNNPLAQKFINAQ